MKSLYKQLGGTYHLGEDGLLYSSLPLSSMPITHLTEIDAAAHDRSKLLTKQPV